MPASAELIEYALGRRFAKTYGKAFDQHFADFDVVDEVALADFLVDRGRDGRADLR